MKRLRMVIALVSLGSAGWASTSHAQNAPSHARRGGHEPAPEKGSKARAMPKSTTTTTQGTYDPIEMRELERREMPTTWKATPNRALLLTGGTMFAGSYATTAVVGLVSPLHADERLFIPVVGPWMNLAERPCGLGSCGGKEDLTNALILGGGITQALGLGLALLSFVVPERRVTKAQAGVQVTPMTFGRGAGIGAVGTF
jgi:hypothetical protein